jgi:hypothetical protein
MNNIQIQDHINMFKYINLYIHNTDPDEIVRDVFNSDELTDHYIDFIEKLQNNFMNVQGTMNGIHLQNLIRVSYNKYHNA